MQALQYIEIDIDYCSLTYSVAPCQASLTNSPPTGTIKCFNTPATCQDRANFTNVPVTLRFAVPTDYLPDTIEAIPSIKTITFDPATISLGKNLGQRATLTVTFEDHRHSDTGAGFDKYLADRPYDPYKRGTFFGKFRARNPFVRGRKMRWINGHVGQALADMEVRNYIIDSFTGPTPSGEYTLVAKDILKLADGDRAMAPIVSNGFLAADMTAIATNATLSPVGIGNDEYPASGVAAIGGSEIVFFTRTGDVLDFGSPPSRGLFGTTAATHKAQDRVQICAGYSAADPADIINDLLQRYAFIPAAYIPIAAWQAETAAYLNRLYTALIANPTPVSDLVSEIVEQAGLSLWWDDRNQQIGLLVLRGAVADALVLSEENVAAGTLDITEQPDKRISEIHTYFGQINPTTSLTDTANFRSCAIAVDAQADADYGSAAIKEIFSRWIPDGGRTIADRLNAIQLGRFRDPPRHMKLSVMRNSVPEIILARSYFVESWAIQDTTGGPADAQIQVTRLKPMADLIEIEGDEVLFNAPAEDLTNRTIIFDASINNINGRTQHDLLYPAPVAGDTVTFIVNDGVIIGSTASGIAAFDMGTWPAGVTITLQVIGRIQGKGGNGAPGGGPGFASGENGGTALFTRQAIAVQFAATSPTGEIWGGGGGGGSQTISFAPAGGGAGQIPGVGNHQVVSPGDGADGTTESGGQGQLTSGTGYGGGPGLPGTAGFGGFGGAGGAAGNAIDGVSFCTFPSGAGDRRGPQIN